MLSPFARLHLKQAFVGANAGIGYTSHAAPGGFKPITNGVAQPVKPVSLSVPPGAALASDNVPPPAENTQPPEQPAATQPQAPEADKNTAALAQTKSQLDQARQAQKSQETVGHAMAQKTLQNTTSRISTLAKNTAKMTQGLAAMKMAGTGPGQGPIIGGKPMPVKAPSVTPAAQSAAPAAGDIPKAQGQPAEPAQAGQAPAAAQPPAAPAQSAQPLSADLTARNWQLTEFSKQFQDGDWHSAADAAGKMWGPAAAQTVGQAVYQRTVQKQQQQHAQMLQQRQADQRAWWNPFRSIPAALRTDWDLATGQSTQSLNDSIAPQPRYFGSTPQARTAEQARINTQGGLQDATLRANQGRTWMASTGMDRGGVDMARTLVGNNVDNFYANSPTSQWMQNKLADPNTPWYTRMPLGVADFYTRQMPRSMGQNLMSFAAAANGDGDWKDALKHLGRFGYDVASLRAPALSLGYVPDAFMGTQIFGDPEKDLTWSQRRLQRGWDGLQAAQQPAGFDLNSLAQLLGAPGGGKAASELGRLFPKKAARLIPDTSVPAIPRPTDYMPRLPDIYGNESLVSRQVRGYGRSQTLPSAGDRRYNLAKNIPGHPFLSSLLSLAWQFMPPSSNARMQPSGLSVDPTRTYVPAPYLMNAQRMNASAMMPQQQPPSLVPAAMSMMGPELGSLAAMAQNSLGAP